MEHSLVGHINIIFILRWSNKKYLLYLTKGNLFLITLIDLFEACPNWKCQRVSISLAVKMTILLICGDLIGLIWGFLIKRNPEYIKFILHLSWTNHFQRVLILNVTPTRVKFNHTWKLSINFATERRFKVK